MFVYMCFIFPQVVQREATELVEAVQMGAVHIEPEALTEDKPADSSGDFMPSDEDALQMGDGTHLALAEDFIATSENSDGNITIVTGKNLANLVIMLTSHAHL